MSVHSNSTLSKPGAKNFIINYDPDNNRKNIFARKIN